MMMRLLATVIVAFALQEVGAFSLNKAVSISSCTTSESNRKDFITTISTAAASAFLFNPQVVTAEDTSSQTFTRIKDKQFAYSIVLPMEPSPTNKPLQTHLDEVNLPMNIKGYTYGITVDPIRINSLRDFCTPNEVAAKIVMAELRRDGILDVTVGRDPTEDEVTGGYDVEYISDGKRGKKHFVTRTIVKANKLYVLTAQVKEVDWNSAVSEDEVWNAVRSFKVLEN